MTAFKQLLPALFCFALAFNASGQPSPSPSSQASFHADVYLSPEGNDQADGSREAPLATFAKALEKLPDDRDGVIALLGGTYRQSATIPAVSDDAPRLTITAVPGETVVFQGGKPITQWESYQNEPGLYVIHAPDRRTIRDAPEYFDIWENTERVRYRKVLDADGVRAWPGSVTPLEGKRLLFRTRDGRDPKAAVLWRNREASGLSVSRSNVTVRGIRFENYLGGEDARALTVSRAFHVTVEGCEFVNSVQGIANTSDHTRVENCRFREVGLGIHYVQHALDMVVRNCVFEGAVGLFTISDLAPHVRSAIRIYYFSNGATVEGCVSAGFWGGLDIKTASGRDGSRPYHVRHNTFLDVIRSGGSPQPRSHYVANIIGPATGDQQRSKPNGGFLEELGATLESNYFYGTKGKAKGSNATGPEPFVDAAAGDLTLKPGLTLPVSEIGSPIRKVQWSPRVAARLAPQQESEKPALAFVREPSATASRAGALIVTSFSTPATATLRYRKAGETAWKTASGRDNALLSDGGRAGAPVEAKEPDEYPVLFSLIGGELEPETEYEWSVTATAPGEAEMVSEPVRLHTTGGPKTIHAAAPAGLQQALDCALPGDTVLLAKGVYTAPVLLTHGGTAAAPLTVRGAGDTETILDGGKEATDMIVLSGANHVALSGFQVRWFGDHGILAENSSHGTVDGCRFHNQFLFQNGGGKAGYGLELHASPGWKVTGSVFTGMEYGLIARQSPGIVLKNNTAFDNLFAGFYLADSVRGSRITHNTLNFTGNQALRISERDPEALASLVCDFNNYGSRLRMLDNTLRKRLGDLPPEAFRPENDFDPSQRYGRVSQAKLIVRAAIGGETQNYYKMETWHAASGKDAHSLFADPEFADPRKGDFRLLPDSPNRLEGGGIIGAGAAVETPAKEISHANRSSD